MVTKPVAGAAAMERDLVGSFGGDQNNASQPLYKEVQDHDANGNLVGSHSELTDYGRQVDAGKAKDPVGRLILGLDAYNNATDEEDAKNRLPHTFLGNTANGIISIAPDIAITAMLPEEKLAEGASITNKLKSAVFSPFNKVAATRSFLGEYGEAESKGKTPGQAAAAGAGSAADIGAMGLLGGVSGDILAPKIYKTLTESGLVKGGKITAAGIDAVTDASTFAMYPIAKDLAMGKPVNTDEVESGFGMGVLFGGLKALHTYKQWTDVEGQLKNVWADRYAMAAQNFMNASPEAISDVHNMNTTDSNLFAQAADFAAKAKDEPDLNTKKSYIAQASTLAKMSDVKGTVDAILHDPVNFVRNIRDSELPDMQKAQLLNKVVDIYKQYGGGKGPDLLADVQREAAMSPQQSPVAPASPAAEQAPAGGMDDLDAELDRFKQQGEPETAENVQENAEIGNKTSESGNKYAESVGTKLNEKVGAYQSTEGDKVSLELIPSDSDDKRVTVSSIDVADKDRKQGLARVKMQELTTKADQQGVTLDLSVVKDQDNTDFLKKFYKTLGFVEKENSDRNTDELQYMERPPQSAINQTKEEPTDATTKQSPGKMDVGEPSGDGETVGSGNAEPKQPAAAQKEKPGSEVQSNGEEAPAAIGRQPAGEHGVDAEHEDVTNERLPEPEKPYYVHMGEGGYQETPGKSVENKYGLDLFSHDLSEQGGKGHAVSEGSTGLQISTGATYDEAVENAHEILSKKTPEEMQAIIKNQYESGKQSPRGITSQKGADTKGTEAVIAKATATVGKAKATKRGSAEHAGVIDDIDKSIASIDEELSAAGHTQEPGEEPKAEPSPEPEQTDKQKNRAAMDDELKAAKKAFMATFNKIMSGVNPETIEKGIKLLAVYAKIGIHDFSEIVRDLHEELGEKVKDVFEGLKAAYGAFAYQEATEEQLHEMTSLINVRRAKYEDIIKSENETGSESNKLEADAPGVDEGEQPAAASKPAQAGQAKGVSGKESDGGGEAGNKPAQPRNVKPGSAERSNPGDNNAGAGEQLPGNTAKRTDTGSDVSANAKKRQLAPQDRNHVIEPGDTIVPSGQVSKFNTNVNAIMLLRKLEKEDRNPTPDEKKQLAQFVGWGGLGNYLKPSGNYHANNAIEAAMSGSNAKVYTGNYSHAVSLNFKEDGPINVDDYNSFGEAVDAVRKRLQNANYAVSLDEVRPAVLKALMSGPEFQSAVNSTINAHYTERSVINNMWDIMQQMGFKGGNVLESSAGIGHFIGLMPKEVQQNSTIRAHELETLTGRMLKKLYPEANITVEGFEHSRISPNSQDLVIGNVPFAQSAPYDKNYPELSKFSMHNYFIAKSLKLLKPGGMAALITSQSSMDSNASAKFRDWVTSPTGGNSFLVGAVRLPSNAFDDNAGTQVTTDMLVFKKRGANNDPALEQPFRYAKNLTSGKDSDGNDVPIDVNEYYHEHPEQMLGTMMTAHEAGVGGLYGSDNATLKAPEGYDLNAGLKKAAGAFPKDIAGDDSFIPKEEKPAEIVGVDKKEGSVFERNGKLYRVESGDGIPMATDAKQAAIGKSYISIKSGLLDLIAQEQMETPDKDIEGLRAQLNKDYDAFVKKFGTVNNNRTLGFLDENDIDFPLLTALEDVTKSIEMVDGKSKVMLDVKKSDILKKRVNFPRTEPKEADDIKDAVNISLNYRNGLDVGYMARMRGMDPDELRQHLLSEEMAYENPDTGLLETPDQYLSGDDIRGKLARAEAAAEENPLYRKNVQQLKKVQPEDIPATLIEHNLGAGWIPPHIYEDFAKHLLGADISVQYVPLNGAYIVKVQGGKSNAANTNTFAGGGISALDLLDDSLNNRQTIAYDYIDKKSVKNPQRTAEAQAAQAALQEEFKNYVDTTPSVQKITEATYNNRFNNIVERKWRLPDYKYYPGATHTISLRDHQKRGVSRGVTESTLFAHQVGTGKTYTAITAAMEQRRLGTAKKPLIAVFNATLGQFVAQAKQLYPTAKILAPNRKEMEAAGRQRLLSKIALGDWDMIILPHSQVDMISDDPERQRAYIQEQIDEMRSAQNMAVESGDKRLINSYKSDLKALEKELEEIGVSVQKNNVKNEAKKALKIEASLSKAMDRKTDKILNFEQLGIDAIHLDEAHEYKKLGFSTSMSNIRGIDTQRSKKAQSMYLKTRWIQEKTGDKNVNFYTGTPISNTLAEVWTFMRYLRPAMLQRMGIQHFDQFASTFGQVIPSLEQRGSGQFAIQNRFAKFQNLPELMRAFRSMTDVVLSSDVREFVENDTLPKIKGGKPHLTILKQSEALKRKIQDFRDTLEWFDGLSGKEKREYSWVPVVIHGKAKQAAIDVRLLNPDSEDSVESKANATVSSAFDTWKATKANKGITMIFSDRYQSPDVKNKYLDDEGQVVNEAYGKARFNLFEDMKKKLIAKGVPASEIEIVTDSKYDNPDRKAALFDRVNAGDVRIVMGTTPKMGVGVNAQQKAAKLINMDAPDRPMDYEQRLGRVIRQGNENKEVDVENMGVENTLDSGAYKRLSVKDQFIRQIMKGEGLERVMGDPADEDAIPYEEIMAQLSDSPHAMKKVLVDNALKSEQVKQKSHNNKVIRANSSLQSTESELRNQKSNLAVHLAGADFIRKNFPDDQEITSLKTLDGQEVTDKLSNTADDYIKSLIERSQRTSIGTAMGAIYVNGAKVQLEIQSEKTFNRDNATVNYKPTLYYTMPDAGIRGNRWNPGVEVPSNSGVGLLSSLRSQLQKALVKPAETQSSINSLGKDVEQLQKDLGSKFDDTKLKDLQKQSDDLKNAMIADSTNKKEQSAADYIGDQSNIKPALDFLDKLKAKDSGKFMSSIIPIPPAVWNGAIDVMKHMLESTNSTQKAIRVAAQYIVSKGGSEAQAKDFEQTISHNLSTTNISKTHTAPDSDEEGPVTQEKLMAAAKKLQGKLTGKDLSPNEQDFTHLPIEDMNRKELNRYIEVASVMSVDPEGVMNKDVTDLMDRVSNRMNPRSGTAVPPIPPPPGDEPEPEPEDDEPKRRIPKKEKPPMDGKVEDLPEQTDGSGNPVPKENYSAMGRFNDIRVRNLSQLKQFAVDNGELSPLRLTRRFATSKAEAAVIMKTASQRIMAAIGKDGYTVLRQALMEGRLRGVRQRFLNWAESIRHTSDADIDEMFVNGKQSMQYDILSKLEGYEDDPNPSQTIVGLISNGEYDDAREYISDMYENAANNVAYFDKLANGKTFDQMVQDGKFVDPKFQEALTAYKELVEKPFAESHGDNEGVFSDALGPLETYYPLTPTGADAHYVSKPASQYKAPANPNNKFTTGQGEQYSAALADLSNKVSNAIRTSNKARAISALENVGLMHRVTKDTPDTGTFMLNGVAYTAKKVTISPARTVYNNGEVTHIPERYVMMPNWLYREIKPIFEPGAGGDDFSLFGRLTNTAVKVMLGGPIEATSHSYRLLGGILNSMPYMQEWAYKNGILGHAGGMVLNNPFVKGFAGLGKILFTDISSQEALKEIQEMAKMGVIPEKTWTKTWSKDFAELTGAQKVPIWDFSPILYGKNSIDLKARVTMYRLAKAMNPNATPEEIVKMQNELGNYTQSLQGELEKFVKRHGLAPFYSFGGAIYRSGIRSVFGMSPLPLTRPSMKEAFTTKMGAEQMGKFAAYKMAQLLSAGVIGMVAYWAYLYHAQTKKYPWDDKHSKLLKLPFPEHAKNAITKKMFYDEKSGTWEDVDMSFFNPFLNRGVRALGLPKAYEATKLGASAGQAAEQGFIQALNTNLSPYTSSPAISMGTTLLTGDAPYITGLRDKYSGTPSGPSFYRKVKTFPGIEQTGANAVVAATSLNPVIDWATSPLTKALKFKYGNKEDQNSYDMAKSVFSTIFPHLTSPHGNDEGKAKTFEKQQKAIHTTMVKEGTIKE